MHIFYHNNNNNNNKNKTTHTSGVRTQNGGELEAWRPVEPCTSPRGTVVPETEGGSRNGGVRPVGSCDMMRGSLSRTGAGRIQGDAGGSGLSSSVRAEGRLGGEVGAQGYIGLSSAWRRWFSHCY